MILQRVGIHGWEEQDENVVLASLLTGDPLLIGNSGSASMSDELKERIKKHALVTLTILLSDAPTCDGFAEVVQLEDIYD